MAKTLTIKSVKCIAPATGITTVTKAIFGHMGGALAGTVAAVGTVATGGLLIGTLGVAYVGGAGAGAATITGLDSVFSGTDDLYIKVNLQKVWPAGKKHQPSKSQQTSPVNYTTPFVSNFMTKMFGYQMPIVFIELKEWDSGSADDPMGHLIIKDTHQDGEFSYLVGNEDEGSLYEVHIIISS